MLQWVRAERGKAQNRNAGRKHQETAIGDGEAALGVCGSSHVTQFPSGVDSDS